MKFRRPNMACAYEALIAKSASKKLSGDEFVILSALVYESNEEGRWPVDGKSSARELVQRFNFSVDKVKRAFRKLAKFGFLSYDAKLRTLRVYDVVVKRNETINGYIRHNQPVPDSLLYPAHLDTKPPVVETKPATVTELPKVEQPTTSILDLVKEEARDTNGLQKLVNEWVEFKGRDYVEKHIRYANTQSNVSYYGFLLNSLTQNFEMAAGTKPAKAKTRPIERREERDEEQLTLAQFNPIAQAIVGEIQEEQAFMFAQPEAHGYLKAFLQSNDSLWSLEEYKTLGRREERRLRALLTTFIANQLLEKAAQEVTYDSETESNQRS